MWGSENLINLVKQEIIRSISRVKTPHHVIITKISSTVSLNCQKKNTVRYCECAKTAPREVDFNRVTAFTVKG